MSAEILPIRMAGMFPAIALRLFVVLIVLVPLILLNREALVDAALPMIGAVFKWVADDFRLLDLSIAQAGSDRVVKVTVMWQHIQVVGNHVIYPDARGTATASTLLAHTLQGPCAAIVAAFAWPLAAGRNRWWREIAARVLVLLPLLALLVVVDTPFVLAGELWGMVLDALDPNAFSVLVAWKTFLQGGGRYALGLAIASLAIHVARRT